jgi:hypothetical protein
MSQLQILKEDAVMDDPALPAGEVTAWLLDRCI